MGGFLIAESSNVTRGNERKRLFVQIVQSVSVIKRGNSTMMDIDNVTTITRTALYTIIKCSAPMLLVSLVIGLAVSIFQTVTSIQEQTLTFVPKVLGIFTAIMILGHWILNEVVVYTEELWNGFSLYIR